MLLCEGQLRDEVARDDRVLSRALSQGEQGNHIREQDYGRKLLLSARAG
jgi:hypothetical protein